MSFPDVSTLTPLLGQIENLSAQQWITSIAMSIAGIMLFRALQTIESKLNTIITDLAQVKTTTAVLDNRVEHLEERLDDLENEK